MGKSNRIRANRANDQVRSLDTKKQKKGMPGWLMTVITWVVIVAVFAALAVSLMSANGVFSRMTTVLSTDNYKINANMMQYYFNTQYQTFQTNYSSYLTSSSLDTSVSLKEQTVDSTNQIDLILLQYSFGLTSYTGTWFDLFMDQTIDSASDILIYCEEADARGIKLTDEEKEEVDAALDEMEETAATYGYTLNSYISVVYGEGVTKTDVKRALRYSSLASKCASEIAEELDGAIDSVRVNEKYTADPDAFNVIDYSTYTLFTSYEEIQDSMFEIDATTTLTDAQKAEVLAKYNEKVEELKALAETLKGAADADAFEKLVVEYVTADFYADTYKDALKAANEAAKKADKDAKDIVTPSEEDLEAIQTAMVAEIIAAVLDEKTEIEDAVKIEKDYKEETIAVYEKTVSVAFAEVLNTVKQDLFETVLYEYESINQEKVNKVTDDEFSEWAFSDDRQKLDTTSFEDEPDEDTKDEDKTFSIDVYLLTELPRKDETLTRDVAYVVFEDQTLAKEVIADMLAETKMDLALFEQYAANNNVEVTSIENYMQGTLGYANFDSWLYGEDLEIGDITEEALKVDTYYYMVALYTGDGNATWYETVQNTIFSEDSAEYQTNLEATYKVTVREKALDKIDA